LGPKIRRGARMHADKRLMPGLNPRIRFWFLCGGRSVRTRARRRGAARRRFEAASTRVASDHANRATPALWRNPRPASQDRHTHFDQVAAHSLSDPIAHGVPFAASGRGSIGEVCRDESGSFVVVASNQHVRDGIQHP
jgi:hypothetical protein